MQLINFGAGRQFTVSKAHQRKARNRSSRFYAGLSKGALRILFLLLGVMLENVLIWNRRTKNRQSNTMKEINNNLGSLIALIFLFATCFVLYTGKICIQVFAGIFASIVAIYYGYLKQKIEDDKMFKELFESFNGKYNGETNDIFNELRRNPERKIAEMNKENVENIIIDYFNLCAEEYLWYSKGRIPKKVWKAWKKGINDNIKLDQVKELYKKEIENSAVSFYGLAQELDIKF
ncbi:MAG: hypothetical protein Q8L07_07990 [Sediminibacterium sp.]|nr:hypothetical protein [Sediminibacterium sp.]